MFAQTGDNCKIAEDSIVGLKYNESCNPVKIGNNATIRSHCIIYADVCIGDHFKTGHGVLIREETITGSYIVIGSRAVLDGQIIIGSYVKIETGVYIPTHTHIGSHVFIGPNATFTNDKYPQRQREHYKPEGPILEDSVTIGANATLLPGVRIGKGSFIGAGAVVTDDVPPWHMAIGSPAKITPLPKKLREENRALVW